jgi:hypothetical protein
MGSGPGAIGNAMHGSEGTTQLVASLSAELQREYAKHQAQMAKDDPGFKQQVDAAIDGLKGLNLPGFGSASGLVNSGPRGGMKGMNFADLSGIDLSKKPNGDSAEAHPVA